MKFSILKTKRVTFIILLVITLTGGFLRFYNLNWDEGHFFHPDERNIALAVTRIHFFNELNPQFFAYGSFPIYLYRGVGELLKFIDNNTDWIYDWGYINLIGRYISALVSTISILLIYRVGKLLFNRNTGLIASLLLAFCPFLIQLAHFSITESLLIFWLLLIGLLTANIFRKPNKLTNYLILGLVGGLALSTKVAAISFALVPVSVFPFTKIKNTIIRFLLALLIAGFVFGCTSPFIYLDKTKFLESMNYENGVVTGRLRVPYTMQFENSVNYLFQIHNLFWQIGPIMIISLIGMFLLVCYLIKRRLVSPLPLFIFSLTYFAYVGSWYAKFIRYMAPIIPELILIASFTLIFIRQKNKVLGNFLIIFFALVNIFWAVAFFNIYLIPSTRITASEWIYQNIPEKSKILQEHWDDGLPIPLKNDSPAKYNIEQLTIYEPDNEQKIDYYCNKLATADYIVISSRRLYGTLMYLPKKYPITAKFYQLLFSGKLGYLQIKQISSYPGVFGIIINDDSSEETFQVYDHPIVLVFKNEFHLSSPQIYQLLKND